MKIQAAILLGLFALTTQAEDTWMTSKFEDGSTVDYAYGESDYVSIHHLQANISIQNGADIIGPTLSWYEPEKFKVTAAFNYLDVSLLSFRSDVLDSMTVRINSEYVGNNTIKVYKASIPMIRGFEHGPHLTVNFGGPVWETGIIECAVGYTWMWTKYSDWKIRPGKKATMKSSSAQKAIHLDALLFPPNFHASSLNSYGARFYFEGNASLPETDRFGLYYMIGVAYARPYLQSALVMGGIGLHFGFL